MDTPQILWLVNSVLVVALGFFIKSWMNDIKEKIRELKIELSGKTDSKMCERLHREIEQYAHTHGELGSSGEVVKR